MASTAGSKGGIWVSRHKARKGRKKNRRDIQQKDLHKAETGYPDRKNHSADKDI